jgi:endo-1,3(4)-beta-glucanase
MTDRGLTDQTFKSGAVPAFNVSDKHPLKPTPLWGKIQAPFPTNQWLTDLVLGKGGNPIMPLPYYMKATPNGFEFGYPNRSATDKFVLTSFVHDLSFKVKSTPCERILHDYDPMTVTMQYINKGMNCPVMTFPIAYGSPYVTVLYQNTDFPLLDTSHAILSVNNSPVPCTVSGSQFEIIMNNGKTWMVYLLDGQTTFNVTTNQLVATQPYNGIMRAALLLSMEDATNLQLHSGAVPVGSKISYEVTGDLAQITFKWLVEKRAAIDLLTMALPHHKESLGKPKNFIMKNSYETIKGKMTGVVGDEWVLQEELTKTRWFEKTQFSDQTVQILQTVLKEDKSMTPKAQDTYFFGKEIAAMGRLALIADQIGDNTTAKEIRDSMKKFLTPRLEGQCNDTLIYDSTWGGIISSEGIKNSGNEFGQGWYNDHHFHYGYWIYAAAVIAKEDKEWGSKYSDFILDLIRDIANPSNDDIYFPVTRNKDWYLGHSWASGLFEFGDDKNQESTSEAVNAYYAVHLWGAAVGDEFTSNLGRVLLATEIRSSQKYWHMYPENFDVYDPVFAKNSVVGVLWSSKVDYSTWFGANVEFIHLIQMLPFTPISSQLLESAWIKYEFPILETVLTRKNPPLEDGWRGLLYMAQAIIDPESAWKNIQTLKTFDDGNSRTNAYQWVLTQLTKQQLQDQS